MPIAVGSAIILLVILLGRRGLTLKNVFHDYEMDGTTFFLPPFMLKPIPFSLVKEFSVYKFDEGSALNKLGMIGFKLRNRHDRELYFTQKCHVRPEDDPCDAVMIMRSSESKDEFAKKLQVSVPMRVVENFKK